MEYFCCSLSYFRLEISCHLICIEFSVRNREEQQSVSLERINVTACKYMEREFHRVVYEEDSPED